MEVSSEGSEQDYESTELKLVGCRISGITEPITNVIWTLEGSDVTNLADGELHGFCLFLNFENFSVIN